MKYDHINHEPVIVKLAAYVLSESRQEWFKIFFKQRRLKVGSSLNEWLKVILAISRGSILGPILFSIFINELLFFTKQVDICNFYDNSALQNCRKYLELVSQILSMNTDVAILINWFKNREIQCKPQKFPTYVLSEN